eukprot:403371277
MTTINPLITGYTQSQQTGIYLNYDDVEIRRFDKIFTPSKFYIELLFYSTQSSGYYIFARQDNSQKPLDIFSLSVNPSGYFQLTLLLKTQGQKIYNTYIPSVIGWNYIVINYEEYGIGQQKYFSVEVQARNRNKYWEMRNYTMSNGQMGRQEWEFIVKDVLDQVDDKTTAYESVGHSQVKALGSLTNRHFQGIIKFINYKNFDFKNLMQNDIEYFAQLDLQELDTSKQIVLDQNDISGLKPYGTNYLYLGTFPLSPEDSDPYYLRNIGLLTKPGKYLFRQSTVADQAFIISNPEYFTIELWFRLNTQFNTQYQGQESILFGKYQTINAVSSPIQWDLAISQYDDVIRVYVDSKFIDVKIQDIYNQTYYDLYVNTTTGSLSKRLVNNYWKNLAITFIRQQSQQQTLVQIVYQENEVFNDQLISGLQNCQKIWGDPTYCELCSGHTMTQNMYKQCFSSCDFNTYNSACDRFFYNKTLKDYQKCNDKCLKCSDTLNLNCEYCRDQATDIFNYDLNQTMRLGGKACISECPQNYQYLMGMCVPDYQKLSEIYRQSQVFFDKVCYNQLNCPLSCSAGEFMIENQTCIQCNQRPPGKPRNIMQYALGGFCQEICGKGYNYGMLECDDGNTQNDDGCSSACTIESGWQCDGGFYDRPDSCKYIKTQIQAAKFIEDSDFYLKAQFSRHVTITAYQNKFSLELDSYAIANILYSLLKNIIDNQSQDDNLEIEFHQIYAIICSSGFTLTILQTLVIYKPLTVILIVIHYHQILFLIVSALTSLTTNQEELESFLRHLSLYFPKFKNIFINDLIDEYLSYESVQIDVTKISIKHKLLEITSINIIKNLSGYISLWIVFLTILVPLQITLGFLLERILRLKGYHFNKGNQLYHFSKNLIHQPIFSQIIWLFIASFIPMLYKWHRIIERRFSFIVNGYKQQSESARRYYDLVFIRIIGGYLIDIFISDSSSQWCTIYFCITSVVMIVVNSWFRVYQYFDSNLFAVIFEVYILILSILILTDQSYQSAFSYKDYVKSLQLRDLKQQQDEKKRKEIQKKKLKKSLFIPLSYNALDQQNVNQNLSDKITNNQITGNTVVNQANQDTLVKQQYIGEVNAQRFIQELLYQQNQKNLDNNNDGSQKDQQNDNIKEANNQVDRKNNEIQEDEDQNNYTSNLNDSNSHINNQLDDVQDEIKTKKLTKNPENKMIQKQLIQEVDQTKLTNDTKIQAPIITVNSDAIVDDIIEQILTNKQPEIQGNAKKKDENIVNVGDKKDLNYYYGVKKQNNLDDEHDNNGAYRIYS